VNISGFLVVINIQIVIQSDKVTILEKTAPKQINQQI
jgi:hypothetical protein